MRLTTCGIVTALLLSASASAGEHRPKLEQDECARRTSACEQKCDPMDGKERLSCKTDCRLAESKCRNGKR